MLSFEPFFTSSKNFLCSFLSSSSFSQLKNCSEFSFLIFISQSQKSLSPALRPAPNHSLHCNQLNPLSIHCLVISSLKSINGLLSSCQLVIIFLFKHFNLIYKALAYEQTS